MRNGIELIKHFEGCKLKAYLCPAGIPTIGYGDTDQVSMADVKNGRTITQAEAEQRLDRQYDIFDTGVRKLLQLARRSLNENQIGALVCFAYNVGLGNLKKSGLLKVCLAGDFSAVPTQFNKWTKGGGKVLPGLVTRRAAEAELFGAPVQS